MKYIEDFTLEHINKFKQKENKKEVEFHQKNIEEIYDYCVYLMKFSQIIFLANNTMNISFGMNIEVIKKHITEMLDIVNDCVNLTIGGNFDLTSKTFKNSINSESKADNTFDHIIEMLNAKNRKFSTYYLFEVSKDLEKLRRYINSLETNFNYDVPKHIIDMLLEMFKYNKKEHKNELEKRQRTLQTSYD